MSDRSPTRWQRARSWLATLLLTIAAWIDSTALYGFEDGEWHVIPIHEDDMPGVWVPMDKPEYQKLIPFGYPYPDGQEIDWDTVPAYEDIA